MSIRATCPCGKAFLAKPELAGKAVKCPACGGTFRVPQAKSAPAADEDPLGLGDLANTDFGSLPPATATRSALSSPTTYAAPRSKKSGGGGVPRGVVIGLIVGGVLLAGVVGLGIVLALLLPAVQAARNAARNAAAAQAGKAPSAGPWQTFTSPTGGYLVSLPGMPQIRSQPVPTPAGMATLTMAMIDRGREGAYFAAHMEAPVGGTWQASLDTCVQGAMQNIQGQAVSSRDITVAGNPARESDFEGTKDGRAFCGRIQLFRSGTVQYQLMWIGPKGTKPDSDLQRFFNSFQLTRAAAPVITPPAAPSTLPKTTPPAVLPAGSTGSPPRAAPPGFAPPPPTVPGQRPPLSDTQRQSIYRSLASFERLSAMSVKQADSMEQAGQRDAAAQIRQHREESRKRILSTVAKANGISEAEAEEIFQTGKRENWSNQ